MSTLNSKTNQRVANTSNQPQEAKVSIIMFAHAHGNPTVERVVRKDAEGNVLHNFPIVAFSNLKAAPDEKGRIYLEGCYLGTGFEDIYDSSADEIRDFIVENADKIEVSLGEDKDGKPRYYLNVADKAEISFE